jgi:hypothetical protein
MCVRSTVESTWNTDKVEPHGYFTTYLGIAAELGPYARVCELGVENGESLRMFQGLFPCGDITGVDASPDSAWPEGTRKVLAWQDDKALPGELGGPFDLIVDDASHNGVLTRKSFGLLWPLVAPGGYYVVEDWFIGIERYADGAYDPGMLDTVKSFLRLLRKRESECESILYRYGLTILKKRRA